jgi:hypothetical protein
MSSLVRLLVPLERLAAAADGDQEEDLEALDDGDERESVPQAQSTTDVGEHGFERCRFGLIDHEHVETGRHDQHAGYVGVVDCGVRIHVSSEHDGRIRNGSVRHLRFVLHRHARRVAAR